MKRKELLSIFILFPAFVESTIEIAFANAYPSNETVCFAYGPEAQLLKSSQTEPIKYSKSVIIANVQESDFIYFDVYGGTPSCSERLGGVWYEQLSSEQVNALIWAMNANSPTNAGVPISNLHWEPDVDLDVYENLAVGFDLCRFEYELLNSDTRVTRTTDLGYGISSKNIQGVDCYQYANIASIHTICTYDNIEESATFAFDLDSICSGITHIFLAVGMRGNPDFPLTIMHVQSGKCQESCADYIRDNPPPIDYGHPVVIVNNKKEKNKHLAITVVVLSILLGICCIFGSVFLIWRHQHNGSRCVNSSSYDQAPTIATFVVEMPSIFSGSSTEKTTLWTTTSDKSLRYTLETTGY